VGVSALAIGRPVLALHYRTQGEQELAANPARALQKADDSLSLNGDALETLYLKSAAYARLDDYGRARAALVHAARLEPHNFVPWEFLGDLAVRRGDPATARVAYRRAWRLNPRDPALITRNRNPPT
jgi:Flp pilus assembly protein TadD